MTFQQPASAEDQPGRTDPSFLSKHNIHPVVFAFGCLFVVFVLYQLVAGTITFLIVGTGQITRSNVMQVRFLTVAGQVLFILVPTVFLARLLSTHAAAVFPLRVPKIQETFYASVSLLLLQQVFQAYLFFQDRVPIPEALRKILAPTKELMEALFRSLVKAESLPELIVVILVVAVVPAIVEELFFRGLIQSSFEKTLQPVWAAVLVGIIFGLYHFNPFALVPLIGLGSFFGFLRFRSKSILVAMTAHFLNNAMAVLAVYFSVEDKMLLGADKTVEPPLSGVLAQLFVYLTLFAISFSAYVRITDRTRNRHDEASM